MRRINAHRVVFVPRLLLIGHEMLKQRLLRRHRLLSLLSMTASRFQSMLYGILTTYFVGVVEQK